jgi:hypothetical protein
MSFPNCLAIPSGRFIFTYAHRQKWVRIKDLKNIARGRREAIRHEHVIFPFSAKGD